MAKKKTEKKPLLSPAVKMGMIALLVPIAITVYVLAFFCVERTTNITDF